MCIRDRELCVLSDVNLELHKGEFVYLIGKVAVSYTHLNTSNEWLEPVTDDEYNILEQTKR